ncbi:thioredoxin TrxC [Maribrevibacterium harenarium]|uniref:Thioredoxin n=1 Tax=Maribrevibacterium harenarium TaxID=2589817 RepID=A0A501WU96_9GAMM|nr:thioredoxin TrxC [Maribrevibacterium harenarium]TPE52869.1 thioredoxin TrxC [Maribrevibacterium harenarium]
MSDLCHLACGNCNALNKFPLQRLQDGPKCGKCKQPLLLTTPLALTSATFAAHGLNGDLPVLIDFWAPWCGPCQMMAPQFASAAQQLFGEVVLAKVDTEAEPQLGSKYHVRSIPTMILLYRGKEVARQSGAMMAKDIVTWVRQNLPK